MKDYEYLQKICLKEVIDAGIKPAENITWCINTRAKMRWGLCKKNPDGSFEIQISGRLLSDDNIDEKHCKETIIHEILHTCYGCMKHTGRWAQYARIMNDKYGYNIQRTTSSEQMGVDSTELQHRKIKYSFYCKTCGAKVNFTRNCKFVKNYKRYMCTRCGTHSAFIKIDNNFKGDI